MRLHVASIGMLLYGAAVSPARADLTAMLTNVNPTLTANFDGGGVYVGQINWQQSSSSYANNGNINRNFYSFCIEVNQDVYVSSTYTYSVVALTSAPNPNDLQTPNGYITTAQAQQLGRMWTVYQGNLDSSNITGTSAQKAAAFQIAIWQILYAGSNIYYPLVSSIYSSTQDPTDYNILNTDVNRFVFDSTQNYSTTSLVALTCGNAQDQITGWNSGGTGGPQDNPLPAPPGLILMFSGIVPMFALIRLRMFSGR